jgi:oligopeptide/dipeptide ABC transporter ATP-binding protein
MPLSSETTEPLLRVENLTVSVPVRGARAARAKGTIRIVDDVSFDLGPSRTLGLVGESGSGKTTLARAILRLIPTSAGRVVFEGRDVATVPPRELSALRRRMQVVFQDPYSSLNPRLRVETIVGEAPLVHGLVRTARQRREHVANLLTRVGLSPDDADRYPHEFSGGQRQRIGIARALAVEPRLIICDEPVSALDVSIQAQVLNLLADLQRDLGLSYVFIAHNLGVVRCISQEVAVMYFGRIVEYAPTDELFENPRHPYTRALLAAAPGEGVGWAFGPPRQAPGLPYVLSAEPPNLFAPPTGCAFHPRCPIAEAGCREVPPSLHNPPHLPPVHRVACRLADRVSEAQKPPPPSTRP